MITAEREWSGAIGEARRTVRPPSLLAAFNWLGITLHGGWFVLLPFIDYVPVTWRTWSLTFFAVLLLLGHLYLWDLRRRRNR